MRVHRASPPSSGRTIGSSSSRATRRAPAAGSGKGVVSHTLTRESPHAPATARASISIGSMSASRWKSYQSTCSSFVWKDAVTTSVEGPRTSVWPKGALRLSAAE